MSTTVTIRLLEKYKRTLVQSSLQTSLLDRSSHGHRSSGGDGVAVTSMEDKFFVHSCIVDESLVNGLQGVVPLSSSFSTAGASTVAEQRPGSLPACPSAVENQSEQGGSQRGAKPTSDERMGGIWKMAGKSKAAVYKRKLMVQHIYPGVVDVLETTPADALEFTIPYNPAGGGLDGGSIKMGPGGGSCRSLNGGSIKMGPGGGRGLSSRGESNFSLVSHSTLATAAYDDDVHLKHQNPMDQEEADDSSQSANIPRCFLTLLHTGNTMDYVLFKVKTNQPRRYRVHPDHQGILSPGDSKMVAIRLLEKYKHSLIKGLETKQRSKQAAFPDNNNNNREEVLKCDDRFFVQYCTVDDVFLREWPNLNDDGSLMGDGGEREQRIAGAMTGMWAAAERSLSIDVKQKRFPVKHVIGYDEDYDGGDEEGHEDLEEEESGASTQVAHPEELSVSHGDSIVSDGINL